MGTSVSGLLEPFSRLLEQRYLRGRLLIEWSNLWMQELKVRSEVEAIFGGPPYMLAAPLHT